MLRFLPILLRKDILKLKNNKKLLSALIFNIGIFHFLFNNNHSLDSLLDSKSSGSVLFVIALFLFPFLKKMTYFDKADSIYIAQIDTLSYSRAIIIQKIFIYPLLQTLIISFIFSRYDLISMIHLFIIFNWLKASNFLYLLLRANKEKPFSKISYTIVISSIILIYYIVTFQYKADSVEVEKGVLLSIPISGWWFYLMFCKQLTISFLLVFFGYFVTISLYLFYFTKKVFNKNPEIIFELILNDKNKIKKKITIDDKSIEIGSSIKSGKYSYSKAFHLKNKFDNCNNIKSFLGAETLIFIGIGIGFGAMGLFNDKIELGALLQFSLNLIISILVVFIKFGETSLTIFNSPYFWIIPDSPRRKMLNAIKFDFIKIIINISLMNFITWIFWRYNPLYLLLYLTFIPSAFLFNISYLFLLRAFLNFYEIMKKQVLINLLFKGIMLVVPIVILYFIYIFVLNFILGPLGIQLNRVFLAVSISLSIQAIYLVYFILVYIFFDDIYEHYELK